MGARAAAHGVPTPSASTRRARPWPRGQRPPSGSGLQTEAGPRSPRLDPRESRVWVPVRGIGTEERGARAAARPGGAGGSARERCPGAGSAERGAPGPPRWGGSGRGSVFWPRPPLRSPQDPPSPDLPSHQAGSWSAKRSGRCAEPLPQPLPANCSFPDTWFHSGTPAPCGAAWGTSGPRGRWVRGGSGKTQSNRK